jgi:hypothetical protein
MGLKPGADGQDTNHLHCKLCKLTGRWTAKEAGLASLSKGREALLPGPRPSCLQMFEKIRPNGKKILHFLKLRFYCF